MTLFDPTPYGGPVVERAARKVPEAETMVRVVVPWRLFHNVRTRPVAHIVDVPVRLRNDAVKAACGKVGGTLVADGGLAVACPKCLAIVDARGT